MLKFLSLSFLIISSVILYFNGSTISGELGTTPNPTHNKLLPTYVIDITTGSGTSYKFQHFYPLNIAVPIHTTVAWFNADPEQVHTVTSSDPGVLILENYLIQELFLIHLLFNIHLISPVKFHIIVKFILG